MKRWVAVALSLMIGVTALTGCLFGKRMTEIHVFLPRTAESATMLGIAEEKGYLAEEGIRMKVTVYDDPSEAMADLRSDGRSLDFGYIDAGLAWNALDPEGNTLSVFFLDHLSDSEEMIARKGLFSDANSNGFFDYKEIYEGLKGRTVYLETSSAAGGWFKDLLAKIHSVLSTPSSEQLWIAGDASPYLNGYEPPNQDQEYKVTVVNGKNADIPTVMKATGTDRIDIAVGSAPVPDIFMASYGGVETIASTNTHLSDRYFPSTWVASTAWLTEEPETAQKVVNAFYKAVAYRSASEANRKESLEAAGRLSGSAIVSYDLSALVWPTGQEYKEWFANPQSVGYTYMKALYEGKKGDLPDGAAARTFEEFFDDSFILKAISDAG